MPLVVAVTVKLLVPIGVPGLLGVVVPLPPPHAGEWRTGTGKRQGLEYREWHLIQYSCSAEITAICDSDHTVMHI